MEVPDLSCYNVRTKPMLEHIGEPSSLNRIGLEVFLPGLRSGQTPKLELGAIDRASQNKLSGS